MRRFSITLLALTWLMMPVASATGAEALVGTQDCPDWMTNQYVVWFDTAAGLQQFLGAYRLLLNPDVRTEVIDGHSRPLLPTESRRIVRLAPRAALIWYQSGSEMDGKLRALLNQTGGRIELNAPVTLMSIPSKDGDFRQQCGLQAIGAEPAWDYASPDTPANVKIAVVDSGVGPHRDLKVVQADDDPDGHGTHVAGIITALEGNGGMVGVVWKSMLYGFAFTVSGDKGDIGHAVAAVDAALKMDPNILVAAWGTRCKSPELERLIDNSEKTLFVTAAGNFHEDVHDHPMYPAAYQKPNLISVMATACDDSVAIFSSYGMKAIDIAAPGASASGAPACQGTCDTASRGIYSTVRNDNYCCLQGTSMSAAFVAGAAALIWPNLTQPPKPSGVKQCIEDSAKRTAELRLLCRTGGRLDLRMAVDPKLRPASCR
jgi:subtilisin family serine protease